MVLFPLFASLRDKTVVVVGGGTIAERKVRLLLKAGATIRVVAPRFCPALQQSAAQGELDLIAAAFRPEQLDGAWLAVAATDDETVNRRVAQAAQERRIFVNVVDDAALSTVQVPALIDRHPLLVGVSSAGTAPMLARAVREQIEASLDSGVGPLAQLAQTHRVRIRDRFPDLDQRRAFYDRLIRGPVMQHARAGHWQQAEATLLQALERGAPAVPGCVVLLELAGDDAGELTLNGLRALNQAHAIFYDKRVAACLDLARRDAERLPCAAPDDGAEPSPGLRDMASRAVAGQVVAWLAPRLHAGKVAEAAVFFASRGLAFHATPAAAAAGRVPQAEAA